MKLHDFKSFPNYTCEIWGSIKNKRHKHSLPINSTNFKKILGLGLGKGKHRFI